MDTPALPDPRVTGPTRNVGRQVPRCPAVEPESGESCRREVGHAGPHEAHVIATWTVGP